MPQRSTRAVRVLTRLTPSRVGLVVGVVFAGVQVAQMATGRTFPFVAALEDALRAPRLHRAAAHGSSHVASRVAIVAIDEASVAKYGRLPWSRRRLAELVDAVAGSGATAIGLDLPLSEEERPLGPGAAQRLRDRFEAVSLGSPAGKSALAALDRAQAELQDAKELLGPLVDRQPRRSRLREAAPGILRGAEELAAARTSLLRLGQAQVEAGAELSRDPDALPPDAALASAVGRARARVVLGFQAGSDAGERGLDPRDRELQMARLEGFRLGGAEPAGLIAYEGARAPVPEIARAAAWAGVSNPAPEGDGLARQTPLAVRAGGRVFASLDAALVAAALRVPLARVQPVVRGGGALEGLDFGGKLQAPTDARGRMTLRFAAEGLAFAQLSAVDVLERRTPASALRGQVVLVAAAAPSAPHRLAGHADALETMLTRSFLRRGPWVEAGELLMLLLVAAGSAALFARARLALALLALVLAAGALWALDRALAARGLDAFAALPLLELVALFGAVTAWRSAAARREKRALRRGLEGFLGPAVLDELLRQPGRLQPGGAERELTALCSEIREFTALRESLAPGALVRLLNDYLSPMTDIVFARRGTLDSYTGDGITAFFGAPVPDPRHALQACHAALQMLEALYWLQERWQEEDPDAPAVEIGIGIHTGRMIVGNLGSSQHFSYAVLGENVNVARRMNALAREYGVRILVSETTLHLARRGEQRGDAPLRVRELDWVRAHGRKDPVGIFELRGAGPAEEAEAGLLADHAGALKLYRAGRFSEAGAAFDRIIAQHPLDGPSRLLSARCAQLASQPLAPGWDGVFERSHTDR